MEGRQFSQNDAESMEEHSEALFQKRRYCFCFPYRSSSSSSSNRSTQSIRFNFWQRMQTPESQNDRSLWARGITALKELRQWSELVAGPKWKTFIRRFNRTKSQNARHANFQYDALSYAMNFDEGPGHNGNFEEEEEHVLRNFSVRYAAVPSNGKASMDLGKDDGSSFV